MKDQLGKHLARCISRAGEVDPAEGVETIRQVAPEAFPGEVIISLREQALGEAKALRTGQVV